MLQSQQAQKELERLDIILNALRDQVPHTDLDPKGPSTPEMNWTRSELPSELSVNSFGKTMKLVPERVDRPIVIQV